MSKFKVGDRVYFPKYKLFGNVVSEHRSLKAMMWVRFDKGDDDWLFNKEADELMLVERKEEMRWFEKIDKLKETTMPKRATRNSAGYDICSSDECVIEPGKKAVIHTNIRAHMNSDEVLFIYPRSSYGIKRDLMLANSVGVIDADYKDEILICYRNMGTKAAYIACGDRVAQGVFTKYLKTKDDDTTEARTGGIGSTGK